MKTMPRRAGAEVELERLERSLLALSTSLAAALSARPLWREEAALRQAAETLPNLCAAHRRAERKHRLALKTTDPTAVWGRRKTYLTAEKLEHLIARILDRRREPLIPAPQPPSRLSIERELLSSGFMALERAINGNVQSAGALGQGAYPFVPFSAADFVSLLHAAWRILAARGCTTGIRFLDVGSGAGTKLALAGQFFSVAHGIEFDPRYLAAAAAVGAPDRAERGVIEADALAFDGYGDYDVIYFFLPFSRPGQQAALEERVFSQARDGTIIVGPGCQSERTRAAVQITKGVFVKGLDPAGIAALRAEAEVMGLHVPSPETARRRFDLRKNLLAEAALAARLAGFDF